MKCFNDLKIKNKLIVSYLVISIITLVVGLFGIINIQKIAENGSSIYEDNVVAIKYLTNISVSYQRVRVNTRDIVLANDPNEIEKYSAAIKDLRDQITKYSELYKKTIKTDQKKILFDQFTKSRQEYGKHLSKLIELSEMNKDQEAFAYLNSDMRIAADNERDHIAKMTLTEDDDSKLVNDENIKTASIAKIFMIALLGVGIICSFFSGIAIAKKITDPITNVVARVEQLRSLCITNLGNALVSLSEGDINTQIETGTQFLNYNTKDEVGDLARSIDGIIKQTKNSVASFEVTRNTILNLVNEIKSLIEKTKEGNLKSRGNKDEFKGAYADLVEGFNETLEAIISPLNESSTVLKHMASGDFSIKMIGNYKGDLAEMKNNINEVADSLTTVISEVIEIVHSTSSASSQISASTEEMAAGAQEQSSQASEVASAVEQMTKTIFETSQNADHAATAARNSGMIALEGGKVVDDTINGMNKIANVVKQSASTVHELGKSSDKIGEIVQVIDDIADQTNLLALNAAIEAARAGEQGRGFAVVADEVRKLAERTTKATKEIAQMIKQIQKDTEQAVESMNQGTNEVEKGKALADKAGNSLKEIILGAEKVVDIISQVAAASQEQSAASEQISKNIEGISNVTHQSADGVQQIAQSAENLHNLTLTLKEITSRFKIKNNYSSESVSNRDLRVKRTLLNNPIAA